MPASFNGWYVEIGNHILNRFKHLWHLYFLLCYGMCTFIGPKCFLYSVCLSSQFYPIFLNQMNHYQKKKIEVSDSLFLVWITAT